MSVDDKMNGMLSAAAVNQKRCDAVLVQVESVAWPMLRFDLTERRTTLAACQVTLKNHLSIRILSVSESISACVVDLLGAKAKARHKFAISPLRVASIDSSNERLQ